ncbi:hypothetical protein BKA65DRAFT_521138 [Rhexocercosporidium sp. MPI-PUGE-AT-0058]|nr:hypothetical protein BKA65DRAFT_521138 [Rhexocercosporidium sp. MPI-PUGE-AT-0058]
MTSLTPHRKKRLQEVASGMLNIYQTLANMAYIPSTSIRRGPHDITALLPLYTGLKIHPSIIYLYSILPYVDVEEAGMEVFFQGGRFADFRKGEVVEEGRDPLFDCDQEDQGMEGGMRSWMTPLTLLGSEDVGRDGGRGSVVIYDAKRHCVGIIDHECGGSMDHKLDIDGKPLEDDDDEGGDDDHDDVGDGSEYEIVKEGDELTEDESWEDIDEESDGGEDGDVYEDADQEEHIYDNMPSRPAPDVLRDIAKWFEDFYEVPNDRGVDALEAGSQHRKHGWPSTDFDAEGYLVDKVRAKALEEAREDEEELWREAAKYRGWIKEEDGFQMEMLREKLAIAGTEDEFWLARWGVWKAEGDNAIYLRKLREVEERRKLAFPDGRLGKMENLVIGEIKHLQESLWNEERDLKEMREDGKGKEKESEEKMKGREKRIAVLEKALEAARKDADKLCPGKSPSFGRGMKETGLDLDKRVADLSTNIEDSREKLEAMRKWRDELPVSAHLAREAADEAIQWLEGYMEAYKGQLQGCIEALKELDEKAGRATG